MSKINFRSFGYVREGRRSDYYRKLFGYPNLLKRLQAKDILRALALNPTDKVLDLGCAYGVFTVEIAKVAGEAVGIDVNTPAAAKHIPRELQEKLRFITQDARTLPFGDDYFDVVFASEVLMMISEPAEFLSEVRRVLKPNGRLVAVNGVGHPVIEKAYRENWRTLRVAKKLWPTHFPDSYESYVNKLYEFFQTAFSFREREYYRSLLDKNGFQLTDESCSPSDGAAALWSWDQFFYFLRTGKPNPSSFFATKFFFFSVVGKIWSGRELGGQIIVAVKR